MPVSLASFVLPDLGVVTAASVNAFAACHLFLIEVVSCVCIPELKLHSVLATNLEMACDALAEHWQLDMLSCQYRQEEAHALEIDLQLRLGVRLCLLLPHMCSICKKTDTGCSACHACRVRDFEIIDIFPYGINFAWEKDGERIVSTLFERNGPIPSAKMLTFFRCRPRLRIHLVAIGRMNEHSVIVPLTDNLAATSCMHGAMLPAHQGSY